MKREKKQMVMDINAPVNSFTLQDQTNYASYLTMIPKFSKSQNLGVHLSITKLLRGIFLFDQVVYWSWSVNWLVYQDKPWEALLEKERHSTQFATDMAISKALHLITRCES